MALAVTEPFLPQRFPYSPKPHLDTHPKYKTKGNTEPAAAQRYSCHNATATSSLYITAVHGADKAFIAHGLQ